MRGRICLNALGGESLDYVVSDELGASVIWVRDAHVYDFHGTPSLSFSLASAGSGRRMSARISDRVIRRDSDLAEIQLYETKLRVSIGPRMQTLRVMLCDSGIRDAPAILTQADVALFAAA